jgi:hypothetical protein
VLAQSQMPTPFVQCFTAASMSSKVRCGCLSATIRGGSFQGSVSR